MAEEEYKDQSSNEVEIDLDKYMALIEKLDEQEDVIKEMKEDAIKAKRGLEPPKRKFMDLFLDDNDLNEKAIIGFISFFLMVVFGMTDLVTALVWDMDLKVSETIYTSFVVVTLGAFGISEAGKAQTGPTAHQGRSRTLVWLVGELGGDEDSES